MCELRVSPSQSPSHPNPIRDTGPCVEGQYLSDQDDCAVYYICDHGRKVRFRCQSGLNWNQNQKVCDWPSNVDCSAASGGGGGEASWQPSTTQRPNQYTTQRTTTTTTQPAWTQSTTQFTTTTTRRPTQPPGGGGAGGGSAPSPGIASDYKVVCYFTNWAWYRCVIHLIALYFYLLEKGAYRDSCFIT